MLDKLWKEVINEETEEIDPDIDRLINSQSVAIRYCLLTQLLGKFTDGKLNCLRLQKGELEDESSWDPRGFASKVIVPWISKNQNVLGTSSDPYVSKPLRRKKLEPDPGNVKQKEEWKKELLRKFKLFLELYHFSCLIVKKKKRLLKIF